MAKVVLIVEDDPKNLKLVRDLLQISGYITLEATDGARGVKLAKENEPDLVLMDIQLPEMDGLEAARILKTSAKTKGIPFIALTSYAMKGDDERLIQAGFDGYIAKPIDIHALLEMVKKYLFRDGENK